MHLHVLQTIKGSESAVIELYIASGDKEVMKKYAWSPAEWRVVFEYLITEHNLLYKRVLSDFDYFVDEYVKNGFSKIRRVLDVFDAKFDPYIEVVFDFIAIANGSLYFHVLKHKARYAQALQIHGEDFIRKILRLSKERYNTQFIQVLALLSRESDGVEYANFDFEDGMDDFGALVSSYRIHKGLEGDVKQISLT